MNINPDKQPNDAEELFRETIEEMQAESQIVPTTLEFPEEVIEAIDAYERAHSVDREQMLWTLCHAREDWTRQLAESVAHLIEDPGSFEWPVDDPPLCVLIAYLRKAAYRWAEKVHEKHNLGDDDDEPADWWKSAE
jgi:hypothetical protein